MKWYINRHRYINRRYDRIDRSNVWKAASEVYLCHGSLAAIGRGVVSVRLERFLGTVVETAAIVVTIPGGGSQDRGARQLFRG